jgi:hypothetical protein
LVNKKYKNLNKEKDMFIFKEKYSREDLFKIIRDDRNNRLPDRYIASKLFMTKDVESIEKAIKIVEECGK